MRRLSRPSPSRGISLRLRAQQPEVCRQARGQAPGSGTCGKKSELPPPPNARGRRFGGVKPIGFLLFLLVLMLVLPVSYVCLLVSLFYLMVLRSLHLLLYVDSFVRYKGSRPLQTHASNLQALHANRAVGSPAKGPKWQNNATVGV